MGRKLDLGVLLPATVWMVLTAPVALGQAGAPQPAPAPAATASSQPAPAAKLEFDVASVRASAPLDVQKLTADMQAGKMPRMGARVDGLLAEYNYMSLKDLIVTAYKVKEYQVTGPDWMGTQRFDISARMPEGSTKDDAPKMLQALLADRFKLVIHRSTQDHPVLALVMGKDGPKLKDSPAAPAPIDPDAPLAKGEMKMDTQNGPIRITTHPDGTITENMGAKGTYRIKMDGQTMHLDADTMTMSGFADMLTNVMQMGGGGGKPVVDMTELKGNYQVAVDISMAEIIAFARSQAESMGITMPQAPGGGGAAAAEASDPGGGVSVFKSVEALGLKLESRKAPVEQIIVDSVEKTPTEN
ncbi:MAG: TIGR03435 family protein [Acidobacteriaceae bacterium]